MPNTTVVGIIAGILTAVSLLPQLIKIIKEKKCDNISVLMLITLLAGVGTWVYYGYLKDDWPIIITNSFSFLINLAIIACRVIFKSNNGG
jgi:MtN3 and saliva related transmembrane protein